MGFDKQTVELFGSAQVNLNAVNIGHVDEEGVKAPVTNTIVEALAGRYGPVPIRKWLIGQRIMVEFNLIQSEFANLENVLPGATRVSNGGNDKLTFGNISGKLIPAVPLILTPVVPGQSPLFDLTIPQAVPIGDFDLLYKGDYQKWGCKFEGEIDEAGGVDTNFLAQFGDASITADVTPPTVSSVAPPNNDTGVVLGSNVVWTMSEDMDGNTVNVNSVHLIEDPLGAAVEIVGVVTLVNAGAATTITFNPDANLTVAKTYLAILEGTIKDLAGNALAFYASDFQT